MSKKINGKQIEIIFHVIILFMNNAIYKTMLYGMIIITDVIAPGVIERKITD